MLSRHFLRAKVLQAFYAAKTTGDDVTRASGLFEAQVRRLNELAVWQVSTLPAMLVAARQVIEDGMTKFRPTEEELHPSMRFVENQFLTRLADNYELRRQMEKYHVEWDDADRFKRLFVVFKSSKVYADYIAEAQATFESDKALALVLFKFLMNDDLLRDVFYERGILWEDDFDQIAQYMFMTLRAFDDTFSEATEFPLMSDSRNEGDMEAYNFALQLLVDAMGEYDGNIELVKSHLNGWDFERVAVMDVLLLVLAITELTNCPSIPERVTIDEYIELSKEFSTERSKLFINGILDRLVTELRAAGRIEKNGRGLFNPDMVDDFWSEENGRYVQ
ncbi:MAG: transcription antitermination protein NusB [Bacteroidales bacterium]|nr:transcription antitermination protein NusB [Bacteroidales bacterium]